MKRYILAILMLIAILIPITVSGEDNIEKTDSLNITSEERSLLKLPNENVQIIKKYVTTFVSLFPGTNTVQELLCSDDFLDVHYMIIEDNHIISYQHIIDGKASEAENLTMGEFLADEMNIPKINSGKNLLNKISSDIEVYSLHYFVDRARLGSCIYYETNSGDFVYYNARGAGEYLLPAKDFVKGMTLINIELMKFSHELTYGRHVTLYDVMDLSKYDINSPSFGFDDNNTDTNEVESDTVESDTIESDTIESDTIESDTIESDIIESDTIESDTIESDMVERDEVENNTNTTNRSTMPNNPFVIWGVVSVGVIILSLMVFAVAKHIRKSSKD